MSKMLGVIAHHLKDVSVLRRLLFAATYLPHELPNFWGVAVEFATAGKVERNTIDRDTAAALIENIQSFDARAFHTDESLLQQLIGWTPRPGKPLGLVLISPEKFCTLCGQALTIRTDRPALIVVYDDHLGPVPGSHFHKDCTNKLCTVTQYYGYYTAGKESSQVSYNTGWETLPYFVSSSLTAFSQNMLKRIDCEVVIGQLSYKQIADIFNHVHVHTHQESTE